MRKNTKSSAKKAEEKKPFIGYATFEICGTVQDVYNGKNANYVTVRTYDRNGEYYTDIQVTCDKDIEFVNGEQLTFSGIIKRFYNKDKGFVTVFSANDVTDENETPFD